jgi:hypothetical protein
MLIISINSFAQNAVLLEKNQSAPFSGTLVTNKRIDKLIKAEKRELVLRDLGLAKDELIDYHKKDAQTQRKKLREAKFDSFVSNTGYFILGCILTSISFRIAQEAQ